MDKLLDIARNSPFAKRRMGGYAVREAEQKDPFVEGICFYAHHIGTYEAASKYDSPDVQNCVNTAWESVEQNGMTLKKVVITVRATSISTKERGTKKATEYPIYSVSYCGSSTAIDNLFFFIHKAGKTKLFLVQLFKLTSREKVTAVTLTVAKAFNIAYKAYILEKKRRERITGSESPRVQRKQLGATGAVSSPKPSHLLKTISPGTGPASGPFTPPVARKLPSDEAGRERAGSLGAQNKSPPPPATTEKAPSTNAAAPAPAITLSSEGPNSGSTHDLTITDELYKEFHDLSLASTSSEIELGTHLPSKSSSFSLDAIKQYTDTDSGSVEDLTASTPETQ